MEHEYKISRIGVNQIVRVESTQNPNNALDFEISSIAEQVILDGPGGMRLAVDIESFTRTGMDRIGTMRFVPLEVYEQTR